MNAQGDVSQEWRYAFVEYWGAAFEEWIRDNRTITVKPDESAKQIAQSLESEYGAQVRLYFP